MTGFAPFEDHFAVKASRGTLWMPVAGEDTSGAIQVPHLLAIPNILVDLLRSQRMVITPRHAMCLWRLMTSSSPACTLRAHNSSAFGSGALLLNNLGPTGKARSSLKPAPSPLMTMTLNAGLAIVWTSPWGHALVEHLRRWRGRQATRPWTT